MAAKDIFSSGVENAAYCDWSWNCAFLRPSFHWHSLHLPTEGWPGWVELGGRLHTEIVYTSADSRSPIQVL